MPHKLCLTFFIDRLKSVRLVYFNIQTIDEEDIRSIPVLQKLILRENLLTSIHVRDHPKLTELHISSKYLRAIQLHNLSHLTSLDARKSQKLNNIELTDLPRLQILKLVACQLSKLPAIDLPMLVELDIRGNQLTSIQLHGLPQLTKLDMSQNEQLATIELKDLPQLKKLSLKKCNLNEIPALHRVLSLTEIDLSENRLMVLGGDIFEGLANLKKLVLSGNNLMMLPDEISMPLKNLEVLLLSTNKIARLPSSLLRMKNLKNIELYSNQLSNVSILTKMDSLTSVNVVSMFL